MSQKFNNRVFGCVILKSVNSNFNADFTHHPRTLPDGTVYATDKALKYAVKDFFRKHYDHGNLFYVKRFNDNLNPLTLDETYNLIFGEYPAGNGKNKTEILKREVLANLLSCPDIRLFGATFAGKTNISIHGPVQIGHGVNRFPENEIYTEDILSPFRNPGEEGSSEKAMSTIGNQTNLKEGHYVYHFSINPKNTLEMYELTGKEELCLSTRDIELFKTALNNAVTALDSSRKAGTENEMTLWIQMKEDSWKMLPSLSELVNVDKNDGKTTIDLTRVEETLRAVSEDLEKAELYYNPVTTNIIGMEKGGCVRHIHILNNQEI